MACALARKTSSSLVALPLGLSFGLGPTSVCAPPSGICSPQMRGSESSDWLGHTYSLRLGRGMAAIIVFVNCLRWRVLTGSCNSLGHTHSDGSPSQCPWRPKKPVGGEKGCIGGPAPCTPLNNDALLLLCPGLFLQTFPVVELLIPVPSGCLFTAKSCPLPGSALQTPFSSTPAAPQQETHDSGWDSQGCSA